MARQNRCFTFCLDGVTATFEKRGGEHGCLLRTLTNTRPTPATVVVRLQVGRGARLALLPFQKLQELVGKKARLEYKPRHPADVQATWADIGKAERLLGWRPQTRFKEGLTRVVAWYRENREWARGIRTC